MVQIDGSPITKLYDQERMMMSNAEKVFHRRPDRYAMAQEWTIKAIERVSNEDKIARQNIAATRCTIENFTNLKGGQVVR
jgi:hypothetical protein